jgi:hypothetical protein
MNKSDNIIENNDVKKKENGYDSSKHRMCFGEIYDQNKINDEAGLRMQKEEDRDEIKDQKGKADTK